MNPDIIVGDNFDLDSRIAGGASSEIKYTTGPGPEVLHESKDPSVLSQPPVTGAKPSILKSKNTKMRRGKSNLG